MFQEINTLKKKTKQSKKQKQKQALSSLFWNKAQAEDRKQNFPVSYNTLKRFPFTLSGWDFMSLACMKIRILLN